LQIRVFLAGQRTDNGGDWSGYGHIVTCNWRIKINMQKYEESEPEYGQVEMMRLRRIKAGR